MTVKELIEKLNGYPENLKIAVNCEISEDQNMANKVQLHTKDDCPYAKGDDVWILYNLPSNEEILFIK